jgi:hypothetical protein
MMRKQKSSADISVLEKENINNQLSVMVVLCLGKSEE